MQKIIMHQFMFSSNFRCGTGGSKPQVSVHKLGLSCTLYIESVSDLIVHLNRQTIYKGSSLPRLIFQEHDTLTRNVMISAYGVILLSYQLQ